MPVREGEVRLICSLVLRLAGTNKQYAQFFSNIPQFIRLSNIACKRSNYFT